jgi:hypothetical protein
MMSNLVKFAQAGLPSVQTLATSLRTLESAAPMQSAILKMDKTGHWVYGADQTEAEDDSRWAVNPFSFVHGFIAWGDGEVLAEKMASVTQPLPELDTAPPGAKKGWEQQVGLMLKCINGEDVGLECRYTTTSVGGKRAVQELAVAIAAQVEADPTKPVPIVTLGKDHYQHKSYGRIYTPVFEIVEWVSMDGESDKGVQEPDAPASDAAEGPRRRRRAA